MVPTLADPPWGYQGRAALGKHARLDSNQRPLPPEGSALSTELRALDGPRLALADREDAEIVRLRSEQQVERAGLLDHHSGVQGIGALRQLVLEVDRPGLAVAGGVDPHRC